MPSSAHFFPDYSRKSYKNFITGSMTVRVIHIFKIINIHDHNSRLVAATNKLFQVGTHTAF